jgi:HAD superfamily phosphoserine phosphatase-like hydrolase
MVSVIIPALNEENTIRQVIDLAGNSNLVDEILVIDDKSSDNTIKKARLPKVRIFTSSELGKGSSMRDGMLLARNEVLVFIDADIVTYPPDIIDLLAGPIIKDEADFVKSYFDRQAGRVTELVAKPLLSILFPGLISFAQPLSGMIACKKSLMKKIGIENDYGVDIGILLDMYSMGIRIKEVNLGYLENRMQSIEQLSRMSREVTRAILKRVRNMEVRNLETLENINMIRTQMEFAIRESLLGMEKMIIFDMDKTILEGSFIRTAAEEFNFTDELLKIQAEYPNPYTRTKSIAKLMKGRSLDEILGVADKIKIVSDAGDVIGQLKKRGYICGIISDSYDVVTNHIKNKLRMDFSLANELEFSKSIATGEVKVPSVFLKNDSSKCSHDFCKSNALIKLTEKYNIDIKNTIAVGDSENDICIVEQSGIGISFCSDDDVLNRVADIIIKERSFAEILEIAY